MMARFFWLVLALLGCECEVEPPHDVDAPGDYDDSRPPAPYNP